jgi:UDP-N-acetylmuramate: L-alanyl-gamma-D-glutamyl-meso-diaminopimelate ligase
MQTRGVARGISVLDDFAHHPTAIAATIAGLTAQMQREGRSGRILAVIEPRSNTMKLGVMAAKLAPSLELADQTFAFAGGIDWDIALALQPLAQRAEVFRDLDLLVQAVASQARTGDQVLVMSNGGFGGVHEKILSALQSSQR